MKISTKLFIERLFKRLCINMKNMKCFYISLPLIKTAAPTAVQLANCILDMILEITHTQGGDGEDGGQLHQLSNCSEGKINDAVLTTFRFIS
jgi:hypothetical protein